MTARTTVTPMTSGEAAGPALVFDEPVSLWGGVDPATGVVVDRLHPQHGVSISGAVVFMPFGRGSSSASSVLVEMVRLGTAPAAFVLRGQDEMLIIGALVAEELYERSVPVVIADDLDVRTGDRVRIDGDALEIDRG